MSTDPTIPAGVWATPDEHLADARRFVVDPRVRGVVERARPLTADHLDQLRCLLPPPGERTEGVTDAA